MKFWMLAGVLLLPMLMSGCGSDDDTTNAAEAGTTTDGTSTGGTGALTLTSPGIENGLLLDTYKCEMKDANGSSDSLPLAWTGVPDGTGALAVTMHHYPMGSTTNPSSYFSLWSIDPSVTSIAHGAATDGAWFMGSNKDGTGIGYTSPCSPSGAGHEYTITLYALSETPASLPTESSIDIGYSELVTAFESVTVLETSALVFTDDSE